METYFERSIYFGHIFWTASPMSSVISVVNRLPLPPRNHEKMTWKAAAARNGRLAPLMTQTRSRRAWVRRKVRQGAARLRRTQPANCHYASLDCYRCVVWNNRYSWNRFLNVRPRLVNCLYTSMTSLLETATCTEQVHFCYGWVVQYNGDLRDCLGFKLVHRDVYDPELPHSVHN